MRKMAKALAVAGLAAAVLSPLVLVADTDIYGNDIIYESDGVTVKYKFWVSGDKAEVATKNGTSAVSSNEDVALDAVFKSVWASVGGWLYSTKCGITLIVF